MSHLGLHAALLGLGSHVPGALFVCVAELGDSF